MNWPSWRRAGSALLTLSCAAGCTTAPRSTSGPDSAPGQSPGRFEATLQQPVRLDYLRFLPEGYDPRGPKRWPLMVFLHGAGERGDDLSKVTVHGPPRKVLADPRFPFVVLSPQCPAGQVWNVAALDALLSGFLQEHAVDPSQVYLTGLSMGGYGTWAWGASHPERFAALVPICGGGEPIGVWLSEGTRRDALRRLPIWAFHGAKDTVVPLSESERMVDAFKRIGNQPRLTVYPEAAHDSWTATYDDPQLYRWLLEQRRP